ncbi:hypothetical protein FJZ18_04500 [Candidatus Pacearchaeota archaeon]|nr:hypothetical protein [Candidatus Pacearchaeota archaeon]
MNKRGTKWLGLGILLTLLVLTGFYIFSATIGPRYDHYYDSKMATGELANPISGMSISEAHERFNEDHVHYFLALLRVYNLHPATPGGDFPQFEIIVNEESYKVVVLSGSISVKRGKPNEKDIVIYTTQSEILSALQNPDSVSESFNSGALRIEYIADRSTLLYKGYDSVFSQYKRGITGNIIRSFT